MIIIPSNVSAAKVPLALTGVAINNYNSSQRTVTLPAHSAGDLLVMMLCREGSVSISGSPPAAGGTVPTWTILTSATGYTPSNLYYAVATGSDTTSGTWPLYHQLIAMAFTGASAIGGASATASGFLADGNQTVSCPAITLGTTDGSSLITHVGLFINSGGTALSWGGSITSGYTTKYDGTASNGSIRIATKNVSTTDGSMSLGTMAAAGGGFSSYASASFEVKA